MIHSKVISKSHQNLDHKNLSDQEEANSLLPLPGILKSSKSSSSICQSRRKVYISSLFQVIPDDDLNAKSLPSLGIATIQRKSASPLSIFYRIAPPSRTLSLFDDPQLSASISLDSLTYNSHRTSTPKSSHKIERDVNNNNLPSSTIIGAKKSSSSIVNKSKLPRLVNSVNRIESSEIITNGKVYPSTGQLYKLSRIEVDKSCPVHGTKAILARSKSSVINSKTSKSSNKINYSPSIKLRSTTTSTHCPSPVNRAAAGKVTSHSHSERVKEADKSGYYQLDYNSKHLKSSSLSSTFPRSYTRMAFFGSIGSSQDQKLAKNMASKVDKPSPIVAKSSQNRIVIRGGKCVNCDQIFDADVFIEDGIIKQIGAPNNLIVPGGCRVIDAKGHFVLPGGIDPHTHLEGNFMGAQSVDDYYHGTKAALAGGTTTVISMPIEHNLGPLQLFDKHRAIADSKACCDFAIHPGIAKWREGQTEKELEILTKQKGVNSFKVFMAYKDILMMEDHELIKVFDVCKRLGALPRIHAENGHLVEYLTKKLVQMGVTGPEGHFQSRPEELEAEAVHRAATLAHFIQAPLYVVHVMSKSAAEEVDRARARGTQIYGEAIAAGLATDGGHYMNRCWRHAAGHILSPPLRSDRNTPDALMNALSSGTLDAVGSDHITFSGSQKSAGKDNFTKIPNGVNGVEERMMVVWEKGVKTGKLDVTKFVAVTSANAAKLFNLYPRKGKIAVGSDADLVIWGKKPKIIKTESHLSRCDFNVFEGLYVDYSPVAVIANGVVVLDEDGKLTVAQGKGRYLECAPFSPIIFDRVKNREKNVLPVKVDRSERAENNVKTPQVNGTPKNNGRIVDPPPSLNTRDHDIDVISTGPPSPALSTTSSNTSASGFHRIQTRSGIRNMQDSSFKLTGEQIDDDRLGRTAIKVHNPPGGRSSGIF